MYKVAVIVPIYNMEMYLGEAIDSVINQTMGFENIQLILVNDGSTDNSLKIMEEYGKKHSNIKIINLKQKSGAAGKPRNEGIKQVEAEYMMFLDPDDFYDKEALEKMYNVAKEQEVEIVTANYKYANEDGTLWAKSVFDGERFKSFKFNEDNFSDSFFVWNSGSCNKIFSSKLIKDNNIEFLVGVPAEDAYFTYAALLSARSAYYLSDTIHYYRRRNKMGTLSVSWDRSLKYFMNISYAYKRIYELFVEKDRISLFRYFYSKTLTSVYYKITDTTIMNDKEKGEALKELSWFFDLRDTLEIEPCQKSLNCVFNMIHNGEYENAVGVSNIIGEMRRYVERDVREGMSKPEFVNYVEL
ncbi:MAG: glycosyltransferase family 2 protein [Clostridia bacterium]|nr:glycosyltransferase family 2 protein [Clostridia bacterium]